MDMDTDIKRDKDKGKPNKPWLAHYPKEVSPTLDYPNIPLYQFLQEAAARYPEHDAIRFLGKSIRYKDLLREAYRFANVLKEQGVKKGDRIALMLPNCPQAVFCYYGILFIGAVVVQVNPLYTERELEHQLNDSDAEIIVCLDLVYPRVQSIQSKTNLRSVIVTGIKDYLPFPKNWLYPIVQKRKGPYVHIDYAKESCLSLMGLLKKASHILSPEPITPSKDIALLQYTGGTTGLAKGAMLTHANLVANIVQCKAWFYKAHPGGERILAAVPFFHVYGMTVAMNLSICIGGCLIAVPKFDVDLVLKTIQKEQPTVFPGAPTMYIALLNHPNLAKYNISSIEACLSGSAALPAEVQGKFEKLTDGRLVEGYGLTECSPVTHANPVWDRRKNGSIGLPWPDTDAQVVSLETGEALPAGEIGELVIKGPQVMKGYWKRTEQTAEVLQEGWLSTGDIAYYDEEGYFYIVDRKKDMIIASGFNVYPREVEEVLFEHPSILEAAVAGVADSYRGETIKAFIVLKKGMEVTEQELDHFCRERLAAYKIPRLYEFRSELPKTMIGKVLRRALVEKNED
jgi:long-chain acyl-CoA synthetase